MVAPNVTIALLVLAVALADRVTVVLFETLWIVVPVGILTPATDAPMSAEVKAAVAEVRVAEALVVMASVTVLLFG